MSSSSGRSNSTWNPKSSVMVGLTPKSSSSAKAPDHKKFSPNLLLLVQLEGSYGILYVVTGYYGLMYMSPMYANGNTRPTPNPTSQRMSGSDGILYSNGNSAQLKNPKYIFALGNNALECLSGHSGITDYRVVSMTILSLAKTGKPPSKCSTPTIQQTSCATPSKR
jgi:hypothetical protein